MVLVWQVVFVIFYYSYQHLNLFALNLNGKKTMSLHYSEKKRKAQYEANQEAQAQAAFAALESWTSPRLSAAATAVSSFQYERSPVDWMKRTLQNYDDDDEEDEAMEVDQTIDGNNDEDDDDDEILHPVSSAIKGRLTTPRVLERANTPVMSNSSKKTASGVPPPPQTVSPPVNLQSPFVPAAYGTTTTTRTPMARDLVHATPLSRTYVHECRQYHEALRMFRHEKQTALRRVDRGVAASSSAAEEHRMDSNLLQSLQQACYSRAAADLPKDPLAVNPQRNVARKEGNFWGLLDKLRRLGTDALWYQATDAREDIRQYVHEQAKRITATPLELSKDLTGPNAPLCLQRWAAFVAWLEDCHDHVLPANIARERPGSASATRLVDGCLATTDREAEVVKAALNLVLAGRLEDAVQMAAGSGLEFLAAQWSGGMPDGKKGNKAVGNPRRALWQVLMWQKAQLAGEKDSSSSTSREALALASLLSNNVVVSFQHPSLRTWERALYAMSKAVVGRIQDDLLHQHNVLRRKERPPYPGTEWGEYEEKNLEATVMVRDLTEAQCIKEVAATPYDEMKDLDPYSEAMVAFWTGEAEAYMNQWYNTVQDNDEDYLRFMAHLALYLDSLTVNSHPVDIPQAAIWRNGIVKRYLDYLSSREELWHMMVLYASFLPTEEVLASLPTFFMEIHGQPARQELLRQMEAFLAPGLDKEIVWAVAQRTLEEVEFTQDLLRPTVLDDRKMQVISWFALREDLVADGLVYANKLLRQFLLSDKISAANHFVMKVFPPAIHEYFEDASQVEDETRLPLDADGNAVMAIENDINSNEQEKETRLEHAAILAYLEAEQAVDYWKGVLSGAEAVPAEVDDAIDKSQLNEIEATIAQSEERRKLAEEKRVTSRKVSVAAHDALKALESVLKFDGGWLLIENEEEGVNNDGISDDERVRREELKELRSKVIPNIILRYREVCTETAAWMSASLYNGVKRLNKTTVAVIADLDRSNPPESSALAPSHWTMKALGIMYPITGETYPCLSVLSKSKRQEILSLMSDTMVAHLKYKSELA